MYEVEQLVGNTREKLVERKVITPVEKEQLIHAIRTGAVESVKIQQLIEHPASATVQGAFVAITILVGISAVLTGTVLVRVVKQTILHLLVCFWTQQ